METIINEEKNLEKVFSQKTTLGELAAKTEVLICTVDERVVVGMYLGKDHYPPYVPIQQEENQVKQTHYLPLKSITEVYITPVQGKA